MSNLVMTDGDSLKFETLFGINTVTPTEPCLIRGTGEANILNKKICILGDEKKVSISATYTTPTHQVKGTGTITITALAADQQAEFATTRTPVIVVGSQFTALFTPGSPASDPQLGPDPNPAPAPGSGKLINSQSFVTAG
ncbi:hypothetical protein ACQKDS_03420 [Serratia sp. NPDC078593]|uniref:hypothetical protein n=1 Tax=unclassified Serratia (in: enterobacteria) TaxID=2647522 RepID=UPI0037D15529